MRSASRRFAVILNQQAGRVRRDPEATRRAVVAAFAEEGIEATVEVRAPDEMTQAVAQAHDDHVDAVVVGGGDGTIAHAAAELFDDGVPLGILPMGTFNLLARDLHLPGSPFDAVTALARAEPRRVDVGFVNGHAFLLHASMGLHPWLIRRRDKKKPRTRLGRLLSTVNTGFRAVRHAPNLDVTFHCHGRAQRLVCRALVVTVGTVERGLGPAWRRHAPDGGFLAVYAARDDERPLRTLWDAAHVPWHECEGMELWTAVELQVVSRHSPLPVALDGDVMGLESPLRFSILPQALEILVPPEDESAAPARRRHASRT